MENSGNKRTEARRLSSDALHRRIPVNGIGEFHIEEGFWLEPLPCYAPVHESLWCGAGRGWESNEVDAVTRSLLTAPYDDEPLSGNEQRALVALGYDLSTPDWFFPEDRGL
jgi:hypothetical protein